MIARLARLLLVIALLGAMGAHWAVLQSVAWATMLADHARTEPLPAAIAKTFDGKHPCALCKDITHGRQSERKSDAQPELKRLEFLHASLAFAFTMPDDFCLLPEATFSASLRSEAPPVPPPRIFAA